MSVSRVTSMHGVSVSAIRVLYPLTPLSSLTAQLSLGTGGPEGGGREAGSDTLRGTISTSPIPGPDPTLLNAQ